MDAGVEQNDQSRGRGETYEERVAKGGDERMRNGLPRFKRNNPQRVCGSQTLSRPIILSAGVTHRSSSNSVASSRGTGRNKKKRHDNNGTRNHACWRWRRFEAHGQDSTKRATHARKSSENEMKCHAKGRKAVQQR